jgi:hypothetical protein
MHYIRILIFATEQFSPRPKPSVEISRRNPKIILFHPGLQSRSDRARKRSNEIPPEENPLIIQSEPAWLSGLSLSLQNGGRQRIHPP